MSLPSLIVNVTRVFTCPNCHMDSPAAIQCYSTTDRTLREGYTVLKCYHCEYAFRVEYEIRVTVGDPQEIQ